MDITLDFQQNQRLHMLPLYAVVSYNNLVEMKVSKCFERSMLINIRHAQT